VLFFLQKFVSLIVPKNYKIMAYSDFSLEDLETKHGLVTRLKPLFSTIKPIPVSDFLLQQLEVAKQFPLRSEKVKSEFLIVPVLTFVKMRNKDFAQLFSGENLLADKKEKLNGEVDFIWVGKPDALELQKPIISLCEAKKGSIEDSLAQCAAQMYGARVYNQKHKNKIFDIYGCVSSGVEWQFMKLEGQMIWKDTETYTLSNLPELLGVWQVVIDFFRDKV
jgi:hypothetical protein